MGMYVFRRSGTGRKDMSKRQTLGSSGTMPLGSMYTLDPVPIIHVNSKSPLITGAALQTKE